jgi:hypothetical protein
MILASSFCVSVADDKTTWIAQWTLNPLSSIPFRILTDAAQLSSAFSQRDVAFFFFLLF